MIATFLMLLLLVGSYLALCGLVYFCEDVIAPVSTRPVEHRLPRGMRVSTSQGDCERLGSVWTPRELRFAGNESMASYVLVAVLIGLVIYLFYAVINPEKF